MRYLTVIPIITLLLITGCITKSPYYNRITPLPPNPTPVTHNTNKIPRPFCHQTNQPNCLAAAYQLLSAELLNTNLNGKSYWEPLLNIDKDGNATLADGIEAWNSTFPSNTLSKIFSIQSTPSNQFINITNYIKRNFKLNHPYLWIGLSQQTNGHAAVAIFTTNNMELLHLFINPKTKTNYIEYIPYTNFIQRTWLVITPDNIPQ